jgi:hypothetical protein
MRIIAFSLLACFLGAVGTNADATKMADPKLDESTFRITIQPIAGSTEGFELHRIQVWTVKPRFVYVLAPGQGANGGVTKAEAGTNLQRADIWLTVTIMRAIKGPDKRRDTIEVENWIRIVGKGITNSRLVEVIPATKPWKEVGDVRRLTEVHEIGKKMLIGKLNGHGLELEVLREEPKQGAKSLDDGEAETANKSLDRLWLPWRDSETTNVRVPPSL